MSGQLSAVIVNYNSGDLLARAIDSIRADSPEIRTVVVDNGSSDDSIEIAHGKFPDAQIIRSKKNLGYARAANLGIAATDTEFVLVCNPDIEVEPGLAEELLEEVEDPTVGAVGPKILNPDGSWYPSARRSPSTTDAIGHAILGAMFPKNSFTRRYRNLDLDPDEPRETDWLSGACILLRRSALDEVGGWDESYFMYAEDLDLCWKLRQQNWFVRYQPFAEVFHTQGVSTSTRPISMMAQHHRSTFIFAAKTATGPKKLILAPLGVFLGIRFVVAAAHHAVSRKKR